jgi:HK97 gp10 family phage protein
VIELRTPGIEFSIDSGQLKSDVAEIIHRILPPEAIVEIALAGGKVIEDQWKVLEAPHTVTGEYQATIEMHLVGSGNDNAAIIVGTPAKQARYLEYGTSKETAQPVMRPAYDLSKDNAQAAMQQKLLEIVRGG